MADLSTIDAILKDDYKELIGQLNEDCWLLPQIKQTNDNVVGRRAFHSIHTTRSRGLGSRAEGGTLPAAGSQGYSTVPVPLRYHYGRFQISGQLIEQAVEPTGAFADGMNEEMENLRNDAMRDRCRQVWGQSNGVIAQCGASGPATVVALAADTTLAQMRHLWFDGGMIVDIGTVANPISIAQARNVTDFSDSTVGAYTITISGANVTVTAAAFVFRSGNGGASTNTGLPGDGQKELTGLQTIVDGSDILHTLNPATVKSWKSFEQAVAGIPTEARINNAIVKAAIASGKTIDVMACNEGVHATLANLLLATKRHIAPNVELAAGYSGIGWSVPAVNRGPQQQVGLVLDSDAPGTSLFGLRFDSLVWYQTSAGEDWRWMDRDGSILARASTGATGVDAYEGTLYSYAELACKRRNTMFKLTGITETTS